MRPFNTVKLGLRWVLPVATLALAGCVPSGFVYDLPEDRYYSSGDRHYSAAAPGYYVQPFYYGRPGNYPWVVDVDHDHDRDDCRHESHRHRGNQRNDRDRGDSPADSSPRPRTPRGVTPRGTEQNTLPEAGRRACAGGKKCRPAAQALEADTAPGVERGTRASREARLTTGPP